MYQERVRLPAGNAIDVTGSRRALPESGETWDFGRTIEVSLRNAGRQPAEVTFFEHLVPGWHVEKPPASCEEVDASTAHFRAVVPAGGRTLVTFRVVSDRLRGQ